MVLSGSRGAGMHGGCIKPAKFQGSRVAVQQERDIARAFHLVRIKVECSRDERFVQGGQSESNEVFDRAEATQRLSRSSRLRSRRMVSHATHDAGLPVF